MNVFCAKFHPFRLNRINILSRFSLFICLTTFFICFNSNQYVTLAFPEGYSRVAFNLFPRKNSEFYPPAVSYRYGYNLAHPTSRNTKETQTGTESLVTAGSELRSTVILPRNLVAPSQSPSSGLEDTRSVIFESVKDINRFAPGIPLLFKIRPSTPREDFVVTPWFQSNPNILLAGSVIPSNFNFFKYTPTPNTQIQTTTETVQEITPDSSESTATPGDEYLPVKLEPTSTTTTTTSTTTTTEKSQVVDSQEFELPFPLPRPTLLKQIDKDDDDENIYSSENPLNYSDHLKSLHPPFLYENTDTNVDNNYKETEKGYPKVHKPPIFFANVVPENPSNISISNAEIVSNEQILPRNIDNETTEISAINQLPYTEDSTTNTDIPTGNKLTRQVQDVEDFDEFLDLPPVHYEPDSVTENNKQTTNVLSPVTTNDDVESETNANENGDVPSTYKYDGITSTTTPILTTRTTQRPSENNLPVPIPPENDGKTGQDSFNAPPTSSYIENNNNPTEKPRSESFFENSGVFPSGQNQNHDKVTTPNSVFVTPILPEDPEQEQTPPSSTQNYNSAQGGNSFTPEAFQNLPKVDRKKVSRPKQSPKLSVYEHVQVPSSSNGNAPLDPFQQLVAALTASVQKITSRMPESTSQQYFSFHIGTININFDNKGNSVPNHYTILSNVPGNPSDASIKPSNEQRNEDYNRQMQYKPPYPHDSAKPIPEKHPTDIPFTVPLPHPIQPSEVEDHNVNDQITQMQSNPATKMFLPSQSNETILPSYQFPNDSDSGGNMGSSEEESSYSLPVPNTGEHTKSEPILPTPLVPEDETRS